MYGERTSFQVFIGRRYVGVPGLIASHDDAGGIGQVTDAGIFQAVKLVTARETEESTHFVEEFAKDAGIGLLHRRSEITAKQIIF